ACEHSLRAAELAAGAYASVRACEYYERALELLPAEPAARRAEVQERFAEGLCLVGQHARSLAIYEALATPAVGTLDRARLTRKMSEAYFQSREQGRSMEKAIEVVEILGGKAPREKGDALAAAFAEEQAEQKRRRSGSPVVPVEAPLERRRF